MFAIYPAFGIEWARLQGMTSHLLCLDAVAPSASKPESQATI